MAGKLSPGTLATMEAQLLPQIAAAETAARPQRTLPAVVGQVAGADAAAQWAALTMPQRREIINALVEVRIMPAGRGQRTFDEASVRITWRTS